MDLGTVMIKRISRLLGVGLLLHGTIVQAANAPVGAEKIKPNVVFISIDDLNHWVGALGGHPLVQTPNIDRLAEQGTVFLNAHVQATICCPSRTSFMTGLRPSTTGIYGLNVSMSEAETTRDLVTLPRYFAEHGYKTLGIGKLFHHHSENETEFDVYQHAFPKGPRPPERLIPTPPIDHWAIDWGSYPHDDSEKGDYLAASWAIEQLNAQSGEQPFFLGVGFSLPHLPLWASPKWFDLYPDDDSVLPPYKKNDRDDTPRFSWYLHWQVPEPRLSWLQDHGEWRNLVRSYLACVSFVDSQIGRVVEAVEASGMADRTLIVLFSDHGYLLGQKDISGKNALWEDVTRVPLIFAGPGVAAGGKSTQPAELLDMYPTLIELCGLPPRRELEGLSLVPQLTNDKAPRARPAITTSNQGNHAVRSERYRYIQYADGTEELYDHETDPNEWISLAGDPGLTEILAQHRRWLPRIDLPPAPGSRVRVLTYDPETDEATWQGGAQPIRRTDPIDGIPSPPSP